MKSMPRASFEAEGNEGVLTITTHNGATRTIQCTKTDDESFILGGTRASEVIQHPCVVVGFPDVHVSFQARHTDGTLLSGRGISYTPDLLDGDAAYAIEYYTLDMEGQPPGWIVSRTPIDDPALLFVNIDCLDGGGNLIKRYRVSPYHGTVKVIE